MNFLLNISEYRQKAHKWRNIEPFNGTLKISPITTKRNETSDIKILLESPENIPLGTCFRCCLTERPQTQPHVKTSGNSSGFTVKYKYPILEFINEQDIPKEENIVIILSNVLSAIRSLVEKLEIFICLPGKGFSMFGTPHIFKKEDMDAESVQLYLSQNTQGAKLRISIAAEQSKENFYLPDKSFNRTMELQMPWKTIKCDFNKSNNGIISIDETLPAEHPASFDVSVCDSHGKTKQCVCKEHIDTSFFKDEMQVFFGDLHVHSNLSDGYGDPEKILEYAQNWKRLDFIALNEHIENSLCWNMGWGADKWSHYKQCIDTYNTPGEFITIAGFEYRSFCNLWCFNDEYQKELDPKLFDGPEEEFEIHKRISDFSHRENWLVGYHRLEIMYDKPQFHTMPPHALLQLAHGARPPETGSSAFLQRGDICGFFGGTDTHYGIPGHIFPGLPRNGQSGLTAIISNDLSRNGLHQALQNRRCYATMGSRHLVSFELNGAMMGEVISLTSSSLVKINLKAHGKEKIAKIEIVKNGTNVQTFKINSQTADISWNDPCRFTKNSYYFARLTLEDKRMIWTSPVWLTL